MRSVVLLVISALLSLQSLIADDILKNGSFEGLSDENGTPQGWQVFCHELPDGYMMLEGSDAKDGEQYLSIVNSTGLQPTYFVMWRQRLSGLNPDKEYKLEFWGRGEISGSDNRFGACDDDAGNQGFTYAKVESSQAWKKYSVAFRPNVDGTKFIIFSSNDFIEGYAVDAAQVTQQ